MHKITFDGDERDHICFTSASYIRNDIDQADPHHDMFAFSFEFLKKPRRSLWVVAKAAAPSQEEMKKEYRPPQEFDLKQLLSESQWDILLNTDSKLYVDFSFEGRGAKRANISMMLERYCINNNVPPDKIIFLTGNIIYHDSTLIKNIYVPLFQNHASSTEVSTLSDPVYRTKVAGVENFPKKMLFLNRRIRWHRTYAFSKILQDSTSKAQSLMSHPLVTGDDIETDIVYKDIPFTDNDKTALEENTPMFADTTDFETNLVVKNPAELYQESLFSLVSETEVSSRDNTELFYSEKTFKPMMYGHPILIIGQQGANKRLDDLGLVPYDDYFDLSFDDEPDDIKRINMLLEEVFRIHKFLFHATPVDVSQWYRKGIHVIKNNKNFIKEKKFL